MQAQAIVLFFYAILLLFGGLIGYLAAGSFISLIMGIVCALLIAGAGLALWKGIAWGFMGGLALSILLALFFGYRFFLTYKMMPAGIMASFSIAVILALLYLKKSFQS